MLLDVGVPRRLTPLLIAPGVDAVHPVDRHLQQEADLNLLGLARAEGRVVVTLDDDFRELLARLGATAPSLILFQMQHMLAPDFFELLMPILKRHAVQFGGGACISVKPQSVRVRELPLPSGSRPGGRS